MKNETEKDRIADAQQRSMNMLKEAGGVEHLVLSLPHPKIDGQDPLMTIGGNPDGSVDYKRLAVLLFQIVSGLSSDPEFSQTFNALQRRQTRSTKPLNDVIRSKDALIQQLKATQSSYLLLTLTPYMLKNGNLNFSGKFDFNLSKESKQLKEQFMAVLKDGLKQAMDKDQDIKKIIGGK